MSDPESQKSPWTFVAADPARVRRVQDRLAAYGVTAPKHGAIIAAVLDQHGLFHEVITPEQGDTGKDILRRAQRRAKALWRRIMNIRNGKELPTDAQEADLAEHWEERGENLMRLEDLKVMSETFQINRGGRVVPRFVSRKSRKGSPQGPRSQPEITHALQILDRYLREKCLMATNRRIECLGDIQKAAMNLPDSREEVSEQVRWRLRDAKKKTPLHNVDFFEATQVSYKLNDDRQETFWESQSILYSPDTSAEEKKKAEDTLEQLFSFK